MTNGQRPLAGRRVLVTRALHQQGRFSKEICALGAVVVEVPVLEIIAPKSFERLDDAIRHLDRYDWLILTSSNTVRAICGRGTPLAVNPANAEGLSVAAVGKATAETAQGYGFQVTVVPETYVAESLVSVLGERVRGKRVLLPRAEGSRDVIPDALRALEAQVDVVDAYQNRIPAAAPDQLRRELAEGLDAATFTSSSSVTHLRAAATAAGLAWPFPGVAAISIGPITSKTLREESWAPAAEASVSDIPGLVRALADFFAAK